MPSTIRYAPLSADVVVVVVSCMSACLQCTAGSQEKRSAD